MIFLEGLAIQNLQLKTTEIILFLTAIYHQKEIISVFKKSILLLWLLQAYMVQQVGSLLST
jgi:hypothetical protein